MKKKIFVLMLGLTCIFSTVICSAEEADTETEEAVEETTEEATGNDAASDSVGSADTEKSEGVMTYEEYLAADAETEVVIEAYVQAMQSWSEEGTAVYAQDAEGGYLIYMDCSEEEYDLLSQGMKIKVTGTKAESDGAVSVTGGTFETEEGNYIAGAVDVTELLGTDELADYPNIYVSLTGLTIEESGDGEVFLYNQDGSGEDGDDLYFCASIDGETYTFTVDSALCDNTTMVYNLVRLLEIGDVMDMKGFLCPDEEAVLTLTYMQFTGAE